MKTAVGPLIGARTAAELAARTIIAEVKRAPPADGHYAGHTDSYLGDCIVDARDEAWKKALAALEPYGIPRTFVHGCCDDHVGATCPECKNHNCDPEYCGLQLDSDHFDWDHFEAILDRDLDGLSHMLMER